MHLLQPSCSNVDFQEHISKEAEEFLVHFLNGWTLASLWGNLRQRKMVYYKQRNVFSFMLRYYQSYFSITQMDKVWDAYMQLR